MKQLIKVFELLSNHQQQIHSEAANKTRQHLIDLGDDRRAQQLGEDLSSVKLATGLDRVEFVVPNQHIEDNKFSSNQYQPSYNLPIKVTKLIDDYNQIALNETSENEDIINYEIISARECELRNHQQKQQQQDTRIGLDHHHHNTKSSSLSTIENKKLLNEIEAAARLCDYLLSSVLISGHKKTATPTPITNTSTRKKDCKNNPNDNSNIRVISQSQPTHYQQHHLLREDNDWILVDLIPGAPGEESLSPSVVLSDQEPSQFVAREVSCDSNNCAKLSILSPISSCGSQPTEAPEHKHQHQPQVQQSNQMALEKTDVELIKASWNPARKDPVAAGILLFKGLFTKFPDYLKFFSQFSDLNIELMHENKRLLKHAVKVIDTVTFVVDSVGDDSKGEQLNEALVNLVKSHLKRRIGLNEFRNLGIVLIDFICDLNNRGAQGLEKVRQANKLSGSARYSSLSSSQDDSETMTSALDKIRASSSPSSSSEEGADFAAAAAAAAVSAGSVAEPASGDLKKNNLYETNHGSMGSDGSSNELKSGGGESPILNTNLLVAAWTKLYSGVLDLVKREEERQQSTADKD